MCAFNLWKTEVFRHGVFLPVLLSGCNADYQPVVPESTNTNTVVWQTTYAYPIVDTDQNRCYDSETGVEIRCTGAGYDADYQGNQPSYTTSSDGRTVLDNVTGLRWTQSTDVNRSGSVDEADLLSQSAAVHYCQTLRLGGYRWRLPNVKEAYSLMLFSGKDASTALGTEPTGLTPFLAPEFDRAFGVRAGERWMDVPYATGTLYVSTTMHGDATLFGVNYLTGRINGYPAERTKFYVRCVTGNTLYGQNSFFDNGNGTITDQATGLMWAQNDHSSRDWDHAIEICESATTAEHTDWRLPNVKELQSLVDYTRSPDTDGDAAIDVLFHSTGILNEAGLPDWGYYWASTTHVDQQNRGTRGTYLAFGRALSFLSLNLLDAHGAGAQRSHQKPDVRHAAGIGVFNLGAGPFHFLGASGEILRVKNQVRCVRNVG